MGSAKRSQRRGDNFQKRATRSTKSRLISDPDQTAQVLTSQLRSLGLYASHTLGDGNCLFRALSDQYYGSPSKHVEVRRDVCDWIAQHPERYEGFVDEDEFGSRPGANKLDAYLGRMRENATYGGHMELSAFAHMTQRNIKVVQPGLVYIIQCEPQSSLSSTVGDDDEDEDVPSNTRDKRRQRRERMKTDKQRSDHQEDEEIPAGEGPILYVAYHDWEHFSSIRNLRGPHAGLPNVQEVTAPVDPPAPSPKKIIKKIKLKLSAPLSSSSSPTALSAPSDPSLIPLPPSIPPSIRTSRSASPTSSQRSPKRSFDESSQSSESSSVANKRIRLRDEATPLSEIDTIDRSGSEDSKGVSPLHSTPFLSPASLGSLSSRSSPLSSVPSSPEPEVLPQPKPEPKLTRRQRKKAGIPKPRPLASAGKIVIPGGRMLRSQTAAKIHIKTEEEEPDVEWRKNGSGRLDVRGFRELKI